MLLRKQPHSFSTHDPGWAFVPCYLFYNRPVNLFFLLFLNGSAAEAATTTAAATPNSHRYKHHSFIHTGSNSNIPASLWVLWCRMVQSLQEGPDEQRKEGWGRGSGVVKKAQSNKGSHWQSTEPSSCWPGRGTAWPREHTVGFVVRSVSHTN